MRDAGASLKVRRWLPPLLWAGVILFITSVPGKYVPPQLGPYHKLVHFTMYGLFGVLLTRDITQKMGVWRSALLAVVIASAFGAADEWHQLFIPGRSGKVADWRVDTIGALSGSLLFAILARRSRATITK